MKYSDDNLRRLFAKGLSFDQMAVELEVTRGVIAGKVHRLGLKRTHIKPNRNTISIRPNKPVEMTKAEMQQMLRKAVENTK